MTSGFAGSSIGRTSLLCPPPGCASTGADPCRCMLGAPAPAQPAPIPPPLPLPSKSSKLWLRLRPRLRSSAGLLLRTSIDTASATASWYCSSPRARARCSHALTAAPRCASGSCSSSSTSRASCARKAVSLSHGSRGAGAGAAPGCGAAWGGAPWSPLGPGGGRMLESTWLALGIIRCGVVPSERPCRTVCRNYWLVWASLTRSLTGGTASMPQRPPRNSAGMSKRDGCLFHAQSQPRQRLRAAHDRGPYRTAGRVSRARMIHFQRRVVASTGDPASRALRGRPHDLVTLDWPLLLVCTYKDEPNCEAGPCVACLQCA